MDDSTTLKDSEDCGARSTGPQLMLEDVVESGAYVCHWSGDLLRIVQDEVPQGYAPELSDGQPNKPKRLTKISDDAFIRISRARLAAANFDLDFTF